MWTYPWDVMDEDAAALGLHAGVRGVEDLRLLQQGGGVPRLGVELPQDAERLGHGPSVAAPAQAPCP